MSLSHRLLSMLLACGRALQRISLLGLLYWMPQLPLCCRLRRHCHVLRSSGLLHMVGLLCRLQLLLLLT